MRTLHTLLASAILLTNIHAQYGTFDAAAAKAARTSTLVVVLDGNQTPYDRAVTEAVKSHWKHAAEVELVTLGELAAQPINPERTYLMKIRRADPVKFEGVFLAVVKGWKMKKGEVLKASGNALDDIPATQDLAWILIDHKALENGDNSAMVAVYVKHLQDYLKQVEGGKITDKATADRLYAGRTRLIRDSELQLAQEHLDKSLPGMEKVKEEYTSPADVMPLAKAMDAVDRQDRGVCVSDVVITVGDHRNKHCFKRVFNAGTGELMYLRDDQAIMGKKEGFLADDLITVTRAR